MSNFLKSRCVISISLIVILILGLMACSKKAKNDNEIKVGYMSIAECLPFFIALEKNYFEDEGLIIKKFQFPGGAAILEAVGANSVDIGFSNVVSLIYARSNHREFKAVWGSTLEDSKHLLHGLVVKKDSLEKPTDLKGKLIALNTLRNIDDLLLTTWLSKYGIKRNEISVREISFPRMPTVLNSGNVDAIAVVEPFLSIVLENGGRILGKYFLIDHGPTLITSYCSSEEWINKNKAGLIKFITAMNKAIDFSCSHPKESREIFAKYTKLKIERINNMNFPIFRKSTPTTAELDFYINLMKEKGWINGAISAEELLYE